MLQFDWPAGSLTNRGRLVNILIQRQLHHYRIRLKIKRREVYLCDTELKKNEFENKILILICVFLMVLYINYYFINFNITIFSFQKCQKVFFSFHS